MDDIAAMYAFVDRIRLFASESVLEAAEEFIKTAHLEIWRTSYEHQGDGDTALKERAIR
jgi:hypothetical protein